MDENLKIKIGELVNVVESIMNEMFLPMAYEKNPRETKFSEDWEVPLKTAETIIKNAVSDTIKQCTRFYDDIRESMREEE